MSNELEKEKTLEKWFEYADTDHDGRLSGADAVKFFERSELSRNNLAKVWALADWKKEGFLNYDGFKKAMDLISLLQSGSDISHEIYENIKLSNINLPHLNGIDQITDVISKATVQKASYNPDSFLNVVPLTHSKKWMKAQKKHVPASVCTSVIDGLKHIYFEKVQPLEELFKFGSFFSPLLSHGDFEAKPSVLLLGQYSTGKTTFIKHLLQQMYPGAHIGPEPTTDKFVVVMHGYEERITPGNTLAVQPEKPFQGLQIFGTGFLTRFQASQCPAKLLEEISLIDTPGVLSGEKQRIERQYDFIGVCEWFASRCDMILLLFDPYKLDISDEFKQVIGAMRGHEDKVRIVLNKADQINQQKLMRVYGALMWSLGKVFRSPEVSRVYIGSFNDNQESLLESGHYNQELILCEQQDLLNDLYEIPHRSCDRKVQREHHLPSGDFPDATRFKDILCAFEISSFPKYDKKMLRTIDEVLSMDIPQLMKKFDNPYE